MIVNLLTIDSFLFSANILNKFHEARQEMLKKM